MIITVTLNPARDRFVAVRDFVAGGLNRIIHDRVFTGGKGNNVAEIISRVGVRCVAAGFLSGESGRLLERDLMNKGVECSFVYTEGETRTNIKIIDQRTRVCTELNEAGPEASVEDVKRLKQVLANLIRKGDVVVFSGSVPQGLPDHIYAQLISDVQDLGAKTILDADAALLREGLCANPDAIKPNINELSSLIGETVITPENAVAVVKDLGLAKKRKVLLSMGANGAMLFEGSSIWVAAAPMVSVVSTVGAGDAMTAALAIGLADGLSNEEILSNAVAYAATVVMSEHFEHLSHETIFEKRKNIRIRRIETD